MPPLPVDVPSWPMMVRPTEYAPADGKVYEIVGAVVSIVSALATALNCQTYSATPPPGALEPRASKFRVSPEPAVTLNFACGRAGLGVSRCRHEWVWLLHSSWYQ